MIGGVTRRTLPRLPGVPHLHVTGPNTTFRGPHVNWLSKHFGPQGMGLHI